jgi:hypothetical protein
MPKAEFYYTPQAIKPNEVYPEGTTNYRPILPATITASNGISRRIDVVVDSGADSCVFPLELALALDLDILKLPMCLTRGAGSLANPTYYDTVTIDIGSGIVFQAYAGFSNSMDFFALGLLGQKGFFDSQRVEFRLRDRVFTVETN